MECGPAGYPPSALTCVHEWGWDRVPIVAGWSAACHPALLACVHIMGARPGPPVLPATAWREWLLSPSEVCLNPLLKTSRLDPSFSLAHGEGSRIQVHHPAHPRRVTGLTLRPTLQTRTLMVQVALSHQASLCSWARAELAFSLPTRSLNTVLTWSVAQLRSGWGHGLQCDLRLFPKPLCGRGRE